MLGITIAGELHRRENKEVIEIVVPPSSVPISLYGRFYIRSGSTVQELHGHELRDFILRKDNTTWDEIIVAEASIADLDKTSIKRFATKAAQENRLPYDAANDDPSAILRKLDLMRENGELTRAAVLLFGKRPRKYIRSALVKIGRFGHSPADLISHDVIEGNLLDMPDTITARLGRAA